ncbi:MAG TPA: hypothetical protein VMW47_01535 [Verrucomicrobiae bacterium]|nr:hypothetical protein [Verrucomicrobiae bacterium]
MTYLMLFVTDGQSPPTTAETERALLEQAGLWGDEHSRVGPILGGERLPPAATATACAWTAPS